MIRDALKKVGKKAALKVFGMERQAEPNPVPQAPADPSRFDPAVIPRVVEGSGDTPGPNHRTNIGRTWLAAQVRSGVAPFAIDLRDPQECAGGMLPGAVVLPGWHVRERADVLPPPEQRIVVYDQLGTDHADAVADWLREHGWPMARRLVGGYAEWIEHDEPIVAPEAPAGGRHRVGDMVQLADGRRGWVYAARATAGGPRYDVWMDGGARARDVGEDDLAR